MSKKRHPKTRPSGVLVRAFAVGYSHGYHIPQHAHDWDQLVYASRGVMTVYSEHSSWVVPSQRAVWVPAGIPHSVEISGSVSMRTLYLVKSLADSLPTDCCVVNVSPLLRELILHAVKLGALDSTLSSHANLIEVILDQLSKLPSVPLQLPLPRDPRALRVTDLLRDQPGDKLSLTDLSRKAGASKRTIERLFRLETGMTFGQWRRQMRLLNALRLLASGEKVITVALESGYESTSAFVAMFRRTLGTTPSRYYAIK